MANYPYKIQRIIDDGYQFNLGDYISKGFNLMMKNPGGFIGYFLLMMLIFIVLAVIPFLGALALMVIAPALMIGPFHVAAKIDRGEETQFSDFFRGFDKFGELFLANFLTGLIVIAAIIPGYALILGTLFTTMGTFSGDPYADPSDIANSMMGIFSSGLALVGLILVIIPAIYLSVSFVWAQMLVWFYDMRAWDAMMASRKLAGKQFWMVLVFGIVAGFIGGIGMLLLLVGILFTYPAMMCAQYAAFADVTQLNEDEPESDVLDHFAPSAE
ncbi:MAG: hypothetical protein IPL65_03125 [Lewinellaceae bacterium]|nr:hypothetical protein [Lewinellaceae bacterium]